MSKRDFDKLVASVKEAGKIRRGEMKASRVFDLKSTDIKTVSAGSSTCLNWSLH
jgi:hypothetical protein